jgi:hypothetical protein
MWYWKVANKAVQSEPMSCGFQARSGQEFAAKWGDGVKDKALSRRSVLDAPLLSLPVAHHIISPITVSRPWAG